MGASSVDGQVEPPFSAVADAFRRNFERFGEKGAAVCIYHRGAKVVDLWGGVRDTHSSAPWREDTVVPMLSTTKGMAAVACAVAASRGRVAYDERIATWWPEFAAHGKSDITLAQLLEHAAGLATAGRRLGKDDLKSRSLLMAFLAGRAPSWPPGTHWGYHIATWGLYVGEVMRRADPAARGLGAQFEEEVARPLGIDFRIGLPRDHWNDRLARLDLPGPFDVAASLPWMRPGLLLQVLNPLSQFHRCAREAWDFDPNDRDWLGLDFASANGVGEVRAVARVYDCLARGGVELGLNREVVDRLYAPSAPPRHGSVDLTLGVDIHWHLGFSHPSPDFPFSDSPNALGMGGFGGSFGFADPARAIGYAYAPMSLSALPYDDRRERRLRRALAHCLEAL